MKTIPVELHGQAVGLALTSIAHQYAVLSVKRVVTVRCAPKFETSDEARWRDLRDTLKSIVPELPEVGEPEWPERYLGRDWITTKSHNLNAGGITFRVIDKQELRKGAKKLPTYSDDLVIKHAREWRDIFLKLLQTEAA